MTFKERTRKRLVGLVKDYTSQHNTKRAVIAEAMNMSEAGLSMILTGRRGLSVDFVERVCKACDVDVYDFMKN